MQARMIKSLAKLSNILGAKNFKNDFYVTLC